MPDADLVLGGVLGRHVSPTAKSVAIKEFDGILAGRHECIQRAPGHHDPTQREERGSHQAASAFATSSSRYAASASAPTFFQRFFARSANHGRP